MINFEIVNSAQVERYIDLRNAFSQFDPYLIQFSQDEFLKKKGFALQAGQILIGILIDNAQDVGYIRIDIEDTSAWLEEIFLLEPYRNQENYTLLINRMLQHLENKKIQRYSYIGVRYPKTLDESLQQNGFALTKDHVQMEQSPLFIETNTNLDLRAYHEINDPTWILKLIEGCMRRDGIYNLDDIRKTIDQKSPLCFVGYADLNPVGFLMGEFNQKRNEQEQQATLYIEELGVVPDERRKGYAAALINEALRRGKMLGANTARLHVFADNIPAYTLYSKLGFEPVKRIGHWLKTSD